MMSTSGLAALKRRPTSSKPDVMRPRTSADRLSHSRAIIGAWLAAKMPTSSAIVGRSVCRKGVQPLDEVFVLDAEDCVVEAQQIRIGVRRDGGEVVGQHGVAQLGIH